MTQTTARDSAARGAVFTIGMRWANRLIAIFSTLILARLLVPEDFGIVAFAFLVLALVQVVMDFGVNVALVQKADATQEHYDSAWTLRILQGFGVAIFLAAAAPLAAKIFGDERLQPVLWVLALSVAIGGFENIGIVSFQKQMQFGPEFRFLVLNRLATFVFVITGAWVFRNYWAMVIGGLLGGLFGLTHSYIAHPMRPRWSTAKVRELFAVSQWLLVRNIGLYLHENLHKLLVGHRTDTATMGHYALAADIASVPTSELLNPLNRVLFPAFVKARENLAELRRIFLLAQGVQVLVVVPAGVCVALLAHDLVRFFFGDKWLPAVPFLQILALAAVLEAVAVSPGFVGISLGRVAQMAGVMWVQALLFAVVAVALFPQAGPVGLAAIRLVPLAAGLALQLALVQRSLPGLRLRDMASGLWRPGLATAVLMLVTLGGQQVYPQTGVPRLALTCLGWGAGYPLLLWAFWRWSGRPAGAEAYLLSYAAALRSRRRQPDLSS
jgi:O-antigen/teichoic acid export membrane protein